MGLYFDDNKMCLWWKHIYRPKKACPPSDILSCQEKKQM